MVAGKKRSSPKGELWVPKGEGVLPNGVLLNVDKVVWPKPRVEPKLNAGPLDAPKAVLEDPNAGVLEAPNAGVLEDPKTGVLEAPNAGVLEDPKAGALDIPNAVPVLPNAGIVVDPKVGVLA
ncbi:hypothetical protein AAC387_Pa10g2205 [Persea americana]